MRTIKFRGKRVDNGEWVCGSYINISNTPLKPLHAIQPYRGVSIEVHPETVGQFTGLKDNNGVEIYEGDINKDGYFCSYSISTARFYWMNTGGMGTWREFDVRDEYEVIGNIHENKQQ